MRTVVFLLSLLVFPLEAAEKKDLIELRARIEALTKELAESEESKSQAADALKESERAISNANRELAKLNAQLQESNKESARLKTQSRTLEAKIADGKSQLAAFLKQMHRSQQEEALKLLLEGGDVNVLSRELKYYSHLARARADFLQSVKTDLDALEQVTAALTEEGAKIEQL
ncbi:MAG: murein hydrolase activator EnvC family protein [Burkholderiales bacterium]